MREQIRTVLRWPLYSPLRLAAVIVAVIVLLTTINYLNNGAPQKPADAKPAPSAPAPSGKSPSASPSPSAAPSASPDMDTALDLSREFVAAWASHKKPSAWLTELKPVCTPRLAAKLATVDPSRIKATKAISARVTDTGGGALTSAAVTTDAGPVTVGLMWVGDHWLVRDIQPGTQAAR